MSNTNRKIIRAVTVAQSVGFFTGLIPELMADGYEVVSLSSDGPELEAVRHAGARVVTVEMARHISRFKDIKSLCQLIKVLRKEKPAMVHSMTPKAGLLCMIAAWFTHVPVRIHTFTGLVFPTSTGIKRRILMATDWLTCACATHVIPEGEGVKNDLLRNRITRKPLKVLGYGNCRGIDLDRFNPENPDIKYSAAKLRKSGIFTFIFIGRIVQDKGINELTEAFEKLYKERNDVRLILVGPHENDLDPISPEAQRIIHECPGIETVGPQDDVRPWLAASDAFVFPSYREGFPNVVIEAGAMSLPAIVTDINGSREIIIEGRNGTIVPPKDTGALLSAMLRIISDTGWRKTLASNARPLIASRFEQSYVRQCLKNFYVEICH